MENNKTRVNCEKYYSLLWSPSQSSNTQSTEAGPFGFLILCKTQSTLKFVTRVLKSPPPKFASLLRYLNDETSEHRTRRSCSKIFPKHKHKSMMLTQHEFTNKYTSTKA